MAERFRERSAYNPLAMKTFSGSHLQMPSDACRMLWDCYLPKPALNPES
jgi:hypothetical protein